VTSTGEVYLNERLIETLNLSEETIERSIEETKEEIKRRNEKFRRDTAFPEIETKTVALVDDGIASGYTMLAAVQSVRARYPSRILVAVPTASDRSLEMLEEPVDEMMCPNIRSQTFYAVADAYEEWHDLSDGEVLRYLRRAGIIEA
jgi:predicted phosphoribosyltransferase